MIVIQEFHHMFAMLEDIIKKLGREKNRTDKI